MITVVHFLVIVMGLGRQHDRLERTLDLEPDRQGFECWLPHLLGADFGLF